MRYMIGLGLLLVLTAVAAGPGDSSSKDELKMVYAENLKLNEESRELDKQLAQMNLQIEQTRNAVANLQYVEKENSKSLSSEGK